MEENIIRTRYEGRAVCKHRGSDEEKGDMDFKPWSQISETIYRTRFYLEDVMMWSEYVRPEGLGYKVPHKKLIEVEICGPGPSYTLVLIEDLDVFDHLMTMMEEKGNDD